MPIFTSFICQTKYHATLSTIITLLFSIWIYSHSIHFLGFNFFAPSVAECTFPLATCIGAELWIHTEFVSQSKEMNFACTWHTDFIKKMNSAGVLVRFWFEVKCCNRLIGTFLYKTLPLHRVSLRSNSIPFTLLYFLISSFSSPHGWQQWKPFHHQYLKFCLTLKFGLDFQARFLNRTINASLIIRFSPITIDIVVIDRSPEKSIKSRLGQAQTSIEVFSSNPTPQLVNGPPGP